jgi:micrococcal nuclease
VWDGNTILLEDGLTVRYIGVDTPGAGMFNRPLEPFGRQAAERNLALVEGKQVEIEVDVNDVDSNGFLLRYVFVDDVMVNETLLKEGLGRLAAESADRKYRGLLEAAEAAARAVPLNIWTLVSPTPRPTIPPTRTPSPAPQTPTVSPSGPTPAATPGGPTATPSVTRLPSPATSTPTPTPVRERNRD